MRSKGWTFKCRACGEYFSPRPTPCKATLVKCPKCGSEDVEFVK